MGFVKLEISVILCYTLFVRRNDCMETIAIIDLGSNSIRMSIFDQNGKVLSAYRQTIRLSEGMTEDMLLKKEPQMRAAAALKAYKGIIQAEGISAYRAVATAAVRKAKNKQEFLDLVKALADIDIEVIDGSQEAALDSLAIEKNLNCKSGIICDIGGGSTELIGISQGGDIPMVSIPYGSRGICEMFFADGESDDAINRAQKFADRLAAENGWVTAFKGSVLVGIGGTLRAIAKLDLTDFGQAAVEGYEITAEHLTELIGKIEKAGMAERKAMAGIGERADIIAGGLVLLKAVLKVMRPKKIAVADVGVREGVFYDLVENRGIL